MKTIIAGGRFNALYEADREFLDTLEITEVVSGGAKGIDRHGERWAESREIPVKRFPALWDRYGKNAGRLRNVDMAVYADQLVIYPGGAGSEHMVEAMRMEGKPVIDPKGRYPEKP